MQLSPQQVERFYRIWFALLRFVNDQRQLISAFPARGQEAALPVADEMQLRNALWADETLQAVLLPFEGQITYDGLLQSYAVSFGPGIRRRLNEAYRNAKEREGIITSLERTVAGSRDELSIEIQDRNAKLLQAFRRHLINAGLSSKMAEQHVGMVEDFAQTVLLGQDPPRGVLEITTADLQTYLRTKTSAPSFKRFVRFLAETGRMDNEQAEALRHVLKQI